MPNQSTKACSLHEPQRLRQDPAHLEREVSWPISGNAHFGPGGVVVVDYRTDDGRSCRHVYINPYELVQVSTEAAA